jgi:hypothetical protein
MSKIDESGFIGSYQVSSLLASSHFCELYEASPKFSQSTLPVILAFWQELEVNGSEEVNAFQQRVRQGSIHSGVHIIPVLDADFDNGHPYIVTPYSTDILGIWREHASFIDQALQEAQRLHPGDAREFTSAFLTVFMGNALEEEERTVPASLVDRDYLASAFYDQTHPAPTAPDLPYPVNSFPVEGGPPSRSERKLKWYYVALLVLLLALLIWGGGALYAIIPASSATITITPLKQQFSQNYSFGVVTGKPVPFEIQGRQISATSQRISKTVPATGKGHHNATEARGTVVFSQIQLNNPSKPGNLTIFTLSDANGVQYSADRVSALSEGGTVKVPVHVTQAGSAGNLPADDVDESVVLTNTITNLQDGTAYVSNPAPFTGGTDARDFTFVRQSDVDAVTKPFIAKVTSATQENVMKQIRAGEHLAKDMQCNPGIVANHHVNSEASDVSVQVSLTCQALVYSDQTIHNAAASAYQHDGVANFGAGYGLVGDMVMGAITTSNTNNDPQLIFNVAGIWSFQYTDARKQDIRRMIAGKSQDAARLLLHARKDIQNVAISTSGIPGSALPSSLENIKIVVTKVSGLHATS